MHRKLRAPKQNNILSSDNICSDRNILSATTPLPQKIAEKADWSLKPAVIAPDNKSPRLITTEQLHLAPPFYLIPIEHNEENEVLSSFCSIGSPSILSQVLSEFPIEEQTIRRNDNNNLTDCEIPIKTYSAF